MFNRRKKLIQVWNNLRLSKWWQNCHFWVNGHLNVCHWLWAIACLLLGKAELRWMRTGFHWMLRWPVSLMWAPVPSSGPASDEERDLQRRSLHRRSPECLCRPLQQWKASGCCDWLLRERPRLFLPLERLIQHSAGTVRPGEQWTHLENKDPDYNNGRMLLLLCINFSTENSLAKVEKVHGILF